MRGCRLQLHWHDNPDFRFAAATRTGSQDPIFNENLGLLAELGWVFELQVFPGPARARHAARRAAHPDLTFVLDPRRDADRRASRGARRSAQLAAYENVVVKLSGQGTFIHRVDPECIRHRHHGRCWSASAPGRAMFGSNFPIESIWTDFSSLISAWLGVLAEFPDETREDVLGRTARRVYRLEEDHG